MCVCVQGPEFPSEGWAGEGWAGEWKFLLLAAHSNCRKAGITWHASQFPLGNRTAGGDGVRPTFLTKKKKEITDPKTWMLSSNYTT